MSSDQNHVYLQYYWRLYILASYIRIIVSHYKRTVLKVLLPVRGVAVRGAYNEGDGFALSALAAGYARLGKAVDVQRCFEKLLASGRGGGSRHVAHDSGVGDKKGG